MEKRMWRVWFSSIHSTSQRGKRSKEETKMVKTLQKPNTCLFRDQVYKKLEEKLIHLHPIEEALRKINRDEKLQAIIKNYAIKYSLERDTEGYYLLGDRDRGIFFWNDTGNRLYIGPDQNEDIAPIFFRRGVPAR